MCLKSQFKHNARKLFDWLKYVELGGAVLVTMTLGIVLGELSQDNLVQATQMLGLVASIVALVSAGTV